MKYIELKIKSSGRRKSCSTFNILLDEAVFSFEPILSRKFTRAEIDAFAILPISSSYPNNIHPKISCCTTHTN